MAESAVSFAVERIGDTILQKAIFLKGVHEQVDRMQRELKRMQCFLKDADAKQQEDERVRNWVSEIRDVAYDAEDAIDALSSM
ncbi:putative disease resistance protein [Vitis vinifera]|uniref:Putative disease resistance protein n=1 Tax=Vitis vinifera TaxID=29760 RepID=A0A438BQF4_VITVI|nr:putative disease resistance protein [Vitis vinifera]